jgi:hypothetical protein
MVMSVLCEINVYESISHFFMYETHSLSLCVQKGVFKNLFRT